MSSILGNKDVNASMEQHQQNTQSKDVKSMDYHRQVFHSKMAEEPYVHRTKAASAASPSRFTAPTVSSRSPFRPAALALARNTATNSSDASSCSFASSPTLSLFSDSSSSAPSPTPSITGLPRLPFPTNKTLVAISTKQYVSPSDNIMSPCSAKINALRNKHVSKAKPKSLFAQASAKKLSGDNLFGSKSIPKA
ncbi:hypothetical protein CCM_07748 [Cordyceps militaris CM01]|uniref:Spo12 n=1 Tax=Cordyceps militaris (strain CM01) TaxID=983644 RepID=G3JQJ2_CORMM|nr:uncharacterized protein CCM_07748 [Cordyceps militaris CM01]EGX89496.1 hypothetical protein CCM_07748 [Cordyceps militaris CM01]